MSHVFVLDTEKRPLSPCHPARARKLLTEGKAAVFRRYPFTIILKRVATDAAGDPERRAWRMNGRPVGTPVFRRTSDRRPSLRGGGRTTTIAIPQARDCAGPKANRPVFDRKSPEIRRSAPADPGLRNEVEIPDPRDRARWNWKGPACQALMVLSVGSCGSVTLVSRSKPSFSSLMCSMATALALASRSGRA